MTIGEMIWCPNCLNRDTNLCMNCKVRHDTAEYNRFEYDCDVVRTNDSYFKGYRPPRYFKTK